MEQQFTMSMFAKKEDLYKAKAEYYQAKYKALRSVAMALADSADSEDVDAMELDDCIADVYRITGI